MLNNLIADTVDNLAKYGIAVIPGNSDIEMFLPINGDSVKPAILRGSGNLDLDADFHATWCNADDDGHITPCEGKWDIEYICGLSDKDGERLIESLTIAQGPDGDVLVEIAWNDLMYTKRVEYGDYVTYALNEGVGRVLATIAWNRAQHAEAPIPGAWV